jgi:glycerol uptake facilitator-like aquaporin
VFAVSDRRNSGLHPSLVPLAIFIVILGIGAAFGMQTGTSRSAQNARCLSSTSSH